jgi:hypothetical protein
MISSARRVRAPTAIGLCPSPLPAELQAAVGAVVNAISPMCDNGHHNVKTAWGTMAFHLAAQMTITHHSALGAPGGALVCRLAMSAGVGDVGAGAAAGPAGGGGAGSPAALV